MSSSSAEPQTESSILDEDNEKKDCPGKGKITILKKPVATQSSIDISSVPDEDLFSLDDDGLDIEYAETEEFLRELQKDSGNDGAVLNIVVEAKETSKNGGFGGSCFNCSGPHLVTECPRPLDRQRIAKNRNAFAASTKKERMIDSIDSHFTPGILSPEARKALNLQEGEYPPWIFKMRKAGPVAGYPPAYLKQLKGAKQLEFFSDDPLFANNSKLLSFDATKIIYYEGFNVVNSRCPEEMALRKDRKKQYFWKAWTKDAYAKMLEEHLKDTKKESRDRLIQQQRWEHYQLEKAKERLIEDFRATNFEKEPEKLHQLDNDFAIFASKKQRKAMDRAKNRRRKSLEIEGNWIKTMNEELDRIEKGKTTALIQQAQALLAKKAASKVSNSKPSVVPSTKNSRKQKKGLQQAKNKETKKEVNVTEVLQIKNAALIQQAQALIAKKASSKVTNSKPSVVTSTKNSKKQKKASQQAKNKEIKKEVSEPLPEASQIKPPSAPRVLTAEEAAPKEFLAPLISREKMPDISNFAVGITPFQYDNMVKSTGILDNISELIAKAHKKK